MTNKKLKLTQGKIQELRFAEIRSIRISELNHAQAALFEMVLKNLQVNSSIDKNSKSKYTKMIQLLESIFENSEFMDLGIAHQKQTLANAPEPQLLSG